MENDVVVLDHVNMIKHFNKEEAEKITKLGQEMIKMMEAQIKKKEREDKIKKILNSNE